jgi:hypothetical protein
MTRKGNITPIGEAMKAYLQELKIDKGLKEYKLIASWEEAVGKTVANATKKIRVENRILYVSIRSSVIRGELTMIKTPVIKRLNQLAGGDVIDDIIVR